MRQKSRLIVILGCSLIISFFLQPDVLVGQGGRPLPTTVASQSSKCLTPDNLSNAVSQLSGGYSQAQAARTTLLRAAVISPACKERVIELIMHAMDKPSLDIRRDQATYYLWREGSDLLGELRATQALDLLISHLGMNDGEWSASMVHQPALSGIIKMGSSSIPKLTAVLRNSDRNLRHDAVYCISLIGGPTAISVLKQALRSESDPCVSRFMQVSISSLDNEKNILKDDGKWFAAFLCN